MQLFFFTLGAATAGYVYGFYRGVDVGILLFYRKLSTPLQALVSIELKQQQEKQ